MGTRPYRAVVFDFDGVIADSMGLHAEAYRRILAPYDLKPTDREIFLQEGARSETIIRDALKGRSDLDDETVKRLSDEKQKAFRALGSPKLYKDAESLVRGTKELCPDLGLVTGTRRENLDRIIPGLLPLFSAVLAQADYSHDKPHPEPYQTAAERLGLDPVEVIVIENAIRGVESAKAAGVGYVIGITTTLGAEDLRAADEVVQDHGEALRAVQRLL